MAQQLGDAEQITATISPMDRAGNAAPVETGSVVWSSSDPTIVTVTPDATNELDALIVAVGALGTANCGERVAGCMDRVEAAVDSQRSYYSTFQII